MELSPNNYDFAGWATRSNQLCADGRTILPDAFKHHDGQIVPLIWNHQHTDPFAILGKALLHCVDGDVFAYCAFNDTESGKTAKELVQHGDVCSLSICANQLKHDANRGVMHGIIRELSLVVAGANPQARIESVSLAHSDDGEEYVEEIHVFTEDHITLYHSDEGDKQEKEEETVEEKKTETSEKTLKEIYDSMSEEQKLCCDALVGMAMDDSDSDDDETAEHSEDLEGGNEIMKNNVFDQTEIKNKNVLTHSAQAEILSLAKSSSVGSLQDAIAIYAENNELQHADVTISGFSQTGEGGISTMFPEYVEAHPSRTPELITNNMGWVNAIMAKTQKIPHGRVRTSQVDIRNIDALKAKGYQKGNEKKLTGNYELVRRTTDPQTVYVTSALHRDDVVDIEDFDYVQFQYNIDQMSLKETLAVATLLGDDRPDGDPEKIFPDKIRPIWTDDELYTIHMDIDFDAMAKELQGSDAAQYFGENFIHAEAMVNTLRKARKDYRGTGKPDMFITTDMLSTMILARDRDGRRIYATENELAAALGVGNIYEVTQMEGKVRTDKNGKKHNLLAICVNMADYGYGASKGGDITHFTDFDIKFNQLQSLLETRKSGQLTRIKSAIVIEELVAEG